MHVKDLGNRRAALVWFGIIVVLGAAQTAAIVINGPNTSNQNAFFFAILGYVVLVALLIVPLVLLGIDRTLRGAATGDNQRAPLALGRIDPTGALAPGESLTLTRTMTGGSLARLLTLYIGLFVFLAALSGFIFLLAPEPLAMALPLMIVWLVILVTFIGRAVRVVLVSRKITVLADDRGITTYGALQRSRFVAWDDIRVVVRFSGWQGSPLGGAFFVLGQANSLGFSLLGANINRNVLTQFTYSGGEEAYIAQAKRLLATIAARSQAPLRVQATGFYGRIQNRTYPLFGLNATDVQSLPPAHPAFQPSLEGIQAAPLQTQQVTLRARGNLFSPSLVVVLVLVSLMLILILAQIAIITSDPAISGNSSTQGMFLLQTILPPLALIALMTVLLMVCNRMNQRAVTVDATGITGSPMMVGAPPVQIPWSAVCAWVVLPPSPKIRAATYAVYSDGPTIVWQEPLDARLAGPVSGDRMAAYRMQADILHAIVATRSGQILRQAPSRNAI